MTEFTITFTADITAVIQSDNGPDRLDYLMSDEFRENLREAVLNMYPSHADVKIKDTKVFISREDSYHAEETD